MEGFSADLKKVAKDNEDFRRVLFTGDHSQLVVMALEPGEDIGKEVHTVDQVLFVVDGAGKATVGGRERSFEKGDVMVVPAGLEHNIINTGDDPLKLFTIYAPPEHPAGTVHHTKADADVSEAVAR